MICKWTNDSQRFILENFEAIHNFPSAIYHSALPLSPSSSWLRECYSSMLSQGVKVVKGLQAEWGKYFRTVSLDHYPRALACWKHLVAVGLDSGDINILDATTGVCMSVFSSHTGHVNSVTFSLDGAFLISGSDDKTVSLWDVQTGGVIKTFCGHTDLVLSVSISPDCTLIASGSEDCTIRLWNIQTGECHCVIEGHSMSVYSVCFSPKNSQLLRSASKDGTVQQWNCEGHQIGPTYEGKSLAFSLDGTNFVSWSFWESVATVRDSDSGRVVTKLQLPGMGFDHFCFSPDGKFIAGSVRNTIHIWNITRSDPCLVETLTGHTDGITSLVFSSSLISSYWDKSVKFWQTGASSTDLVANKSASIKSVSLQATHGIVISSDSAGVVKTWDILSGVHKESFQTSAKESTYRDAQLIDGRLIFIWLEDWKIHIWDTEKGELLQIPSTVPGYTIRDLRISGDGSKVFLLDLYSIQAWSIQTGEAMGRVEFPGAPLYRSLIVNGSRVWFCLNDSKIKGWDFGPPGSAPVSLLNIPLDRPHLYFIGTRQQDAGLSRIENTITREEVFQLSGRYMKPEVAQWDGQYLVAGYGSGEVLILDFSHMNLQ